MNTILQQLGIALGLFVAACLILFALAQVCRVLAYLIMAIGFQINPPDDDDEG